MVTDGVSARLELAAVRQMRRLDDLDRPGVDLNSVAGLVAKDAMIRG
jgi:hypothetical protein